MIIGIKAPISTGDHLTKNSTGCHLTLDMAISEEEIIMIIKVRVVMTIRIRDATMGIVRTLMGTGGRISDSKDNTAATSAVAACITALAVVEAMLN